MRTRAELPTGKINTDVLLYLFKHTLPYFSTMELEEICTLSDFELLDRRCRFTDDGGL